MRICFIMDSKSESLVASQVELNIKPLVVMLRPSVEGIEFTKSLRGVPEGTSRDLITQLPLMSDFRSRLTVFFLYNSEFTSTVLVMA